MMLFVGVLLSSSLQASSSDINISNDGDLVVRSFRGVIDEAISVGRLVFFLVERLMMMKKKRNRVRLGGI